MCTACSLYTVCMGNLLLLRVAVSSYVRRGVSAAAAVRFDWEGPSLAFYGNG